MWVLWAEEEWGSLGKPQLLGASLPSRGPSPAQPWGPVTWLLLGPPAHTHPHPNMTYSVPSVLLLSLPLASLSPLPPQKKDSLEADWGSGALTSC